MNDFTMAILSIVICGTILFLLKKIEWQGSEVKTLKEENNALKKKLEISNRVIDYDIKGKSLEELIELSEVVNTKHELIINETSKLMDFRGMLNTYISLHK